MISLSARIAAGGCGSLPEPTFGCDATRCDPAHPGACCEAAGAAGIQRSHGFAHLSLTLATARGLQTRPEEPRLPHRPCRVCAFCPGRRQPATHAAPTDRASVQFPRNRCSLHTQAESMACGLSCLCSINWANTSLPWFINRSCDVVRHRVTESTIDVQIETRKIVHFH